MAESSTCTSTRARAVGAIMGGFVADAATKPLHWIYDQSVVAAKIEGGKEPAFFEEHSCPFYGADAYPNGALSPYGDELVPLARSMAAEGGFSADAVGQQYEAFFTAYTGRLNHVAQHFLEQRQAGNDFTSSFDPANIHAHNIIKVPLLVARYAGSEELLPQLEAAVGQLQGPNPLPQTTARFAARILEKVVLGMGLKEALQWATSSGEVPAEEVEAVAAATGMAEDTSFNDAIRTMGLSCALPGSLQGPVLAMLRYANYAEAVRSNIIAGGDNCSRAILLGGAFAAEAPDSIPEEWKASTTMYAELLALAESVAAANPNLS